jgi:hypothetical protein
LHKGGLRGPRPLISWTSSWAQAALLVQGRTTSRQIAKNNLGNNKDQKVVSDGKAVVVVCLRFNSIDSYEVTTDRIFLNVCSRLSAHQKDIQNRFATFPYRDRNCGRDITSWLKRGHNNSYFYLFFFETNHFQYISVHEKSMFLSCLFFYCLSCLIFRFPPLEF